MEEVLVLCLPFCDVESLWHAAQMSKTLRQSAWRVCLEHIARESESEDESSMSTTPQYGFLSVQSPEDDLPQAIFRQILTVKAGHPGRNKKDFVELAVQHFRCHFFQSNSNRSYPPYSIRNTTTNNSTSWTLDENRMRRDFDKDGIIKIKADRGAGNWDRLTVQLHDQGSVRSTITHTATRWWESVTGGEFEQSNRQRNEYVRRFIRWILLYRDTSARAAYQRGLSCRQKLSRFMPGPSETIGYLYFEVNDCDDESSSNQHIQLRLECTSGRYFR